MHLPGGVGMAVVGKVAERPRIGWLLSAAVLGRPRCPPQHSSTARLITVDRSGAVERWHALTGTSSQMQGGT